MLYKHKNEPTLTQELFESPGCEYRGTPLWAWNCTLEQDELVRQIGVLKEMGFGGFHMHSRTGMATPYLSEEFFSLIRGCVEAAKREDMLAWIYDEDRWPSGFAGGFVSKHPEYRQRILVLSPQPLEAEDGGTLALLRHYTVELDGDGCLAHYACTAPNASIVNTTPAAQWFAYEKTPGPDPWHNDACYVNALDKKAIDCFCELTHKAYQKNVGADFGGRIPAFFTDEPQFTKKEALAFAAQRCMVALPWSSDFDETFCAAYGVSLLEHLPQLLWNLPDGKPSQIRYHYHAHVSERFAQAYADNIGGWCEANGCALTGHMMEEPTLKSQTACLGEVMRSLSSFGLPGVDMLCDRREFTTVKQAASVAHQYGREGVLSESYGVTGWDFDFRGHKLQSDWQAALGVTVRAPHLSWVSMGGEAKRDYPASLNYQVPWYKRYRLLEDHFARVNTAMVRGVPRVRVAVVHPVESYWLYWGPQNQSCDVRDQLEENFSNITQWLLLGLVDFDYISEALLPAQCAKGGFPLQVGKHAYDVVIVPGCKTLRRTTVQRLIAFAKAGGSLVVAGESPQWVDAEPGDVRPQEITALMEGATQVNFDRLSILHAVEHVRDVEVYTAQGTRVDTLLYGMRQDGDERFLFLAHAKYPRASEETNLLPGRDVLPQENIRIVLRGAWKPTLYDTMTGKTLALAAEYAKGDTVLDMTWNSHDSMLLRLAPGCMQGGAKRFTEQAAYRLGRWAFEKQDAPSPMWDAVPYALSEPNVLVLDSAEYALDGGAYRPREEVLRLDNILRAEIGLPPRQNGLVQPWVIPIAPAKHIVRLRYRIYSELILDAVELALENIADTIVCWNGQNVDTTKTTGFYTDHALATIAMPGLHTGENILELEQPLSLRTNTENSFLLGRFGVRVCGAQAAIIKMPKTLAFGDITTQGLPFYGGNITYKLDVTFTGSVAWVRVPQYRGALVDLAVDGKACGFIAFAPYQAALTGLTPGTHTVECTVYGNRRNTFGALHNANERWWWHGPDAYRGYRDEWSYGYTLVPTGILKSPEVFEDASFAKAVLCESYSFI